MKHTLSWMMALVTTLGLASCGSSDDTSTPADSGASDTSPYGTLPHVDCADGKPIPTYADLSTGIFAKCENCHSSSLTAFRDRQGAPSDVNFDVESVAKDKAVQAIALVFHDGMPPSNAVPPITITEDEKQTLYRWGRCGTP